MRFLTVSIPVDQAGKFMPHDPKVQSLPFMTPDDLDRAQRILFIGLSESDFSQTSQAAAIALQQVGSTPDWQPSPIYICLSEAALIRYARPLRSWATG